LSSQAALLLRAHPYSHRGLLLVQFSLALLGVFWIRSLESRLMDAGLPRWSFWPYFLIVFTACFGGHALKMTSSPETLGLFLLLQLPAVLFQSQPAPAQMDGGAAPAPQKTARPVAPINAVEFGLYLFLLINLWNVLHLLQSDVSVFNHAKNLKLALQAGSWILCVPWYYSLRGRLSALGRVRWTIYFCALTLLPCLLLFYFRELHFLQALLLFAVLQLPIIFLRRKWISPRASESSQD
jgi:hypothetical protein